jgi:1-acyl-sn-glycerol-3-phosphate acyltransferase
VARLLAHAYYRVTVAGTPLPSTGPLLLVANHPNEVFDPLLVAAAADRPVRFLAKAPLFGLPGVGAILRAAGCLPVYRRGDDPALTARNEDTFAAVAAALAGGAAVAIFPEGTSHDAPALAPLKTGAARIALGAARAGVALTIVPVGLVLADRDRARSEALVILGRPIPWDDLRDAAPDSGEAVRQLTGRTTAALESVTLNLEAWADEPLVTAAEAIYSATHPVSSDPAERVQRLWRATRWLRALRRSGDPRYEPLAARVKTHGRMLARVGLAPADLDEPTDLRTALLWTGRRLPLLLAGAMALLGLLLITGPMILADVATRSSPSAEASRASRHLYVGSALVLAWWAALLGVAGFLWGPPGALAALPAVPLAGFSGLAVQQAWAHRLHQARRWFVLRFGGRWLERLRTEQAALGVALEDLVTRPPAGVTT